MRYNGRRKPGSYDPGQGQVTGYCEYGDEFKGLIKCGRGVSLSPAATLAVQERLCSMNLSARKRMVKSCPCPRHEEIQWGVEV